MSGILLVNSEISTTAILTKLLKTEGYRVVAQEDSNKAGETLSKQDFNLMISGADQDHDPELSLVSLAKEKYPSMPIIVIVNGTDSEMLVKLSEVQPFEILEKPLKVDKLLAAVQKAVDYHDAALAENVNLNLQLETCYLFENIVAESPAMRSVCDLASRVSGTGVTVLISGEKGTGKSLIARAMHDNSRRKEQLFQTVDCALGGGVVENALFGHIDDRGSIEKAFGGSLYLKEIGNLSLVAQQKLAATLNGCKLTRLGSEEEVPIDVRVIASSTKDLEQLEAKGEFDPGLHRAIKIIVVKIPPVRNRKEDVLPTVRMLLRQKVGDAAALPGLDQDVMALLEAYDWPGNVAEISSVLDTCLEKKQGQTIDKSCLPAALAGA